MNIDQNMANKIIGGIAAIAIIAVFFLVLNWYRASTLSPSGEIPQEDTYPFGQSDNETKPFPNGDTGTPDNGDTATEIKPIAQLATFETHGGIIKVSLKKVNNPVEKIPGDNGGITDKTDSYTILYFDNKYGRSFLISITSEDTVGARKQAERVFLETFAVTEKQACALPVVVTTPRWASIEYAGKNLGMSFCPGSMQLY